MFMSKYFKSIYYRVLTFRRRKKKKTKLLLPVVTSIFL